MTADVEAYEPVLPATLGHLRVLRLGGIELEIDGHQLRVDGRPVSIAHKEYQLLELLMSHAGRVLSRRELLDHVWGAGYPDGNKTIDVHILRLRRKLTRDGACPIRTVRGLGYVFDLDT